MQETYTDCSWESVGKGTAAGPMVAEAENTGAEHLRAAATDGWVVIQVSLPHHTK